MDYHASKYRGHRLSNRSMRPRHRPFHWLAMSGIMPSMVASAGLHIHVFDTFDLTVSTNGRQTGNPAVVDDFMWLAMAGRRFKQGRA
jgi:hypothetical protein